MIEYFLKKEVSFKLKEKEFNDNCLAYYDEEGSLKPVDMGCFEVNDCILKAIELI